MPDFTFPVYRHNVIGPDEVQFVFKFDNGYGASVVKFPGSYGYEQGLWELALIKWKNDDYDLFYNDYYEDVKGWCNESDLNQHLRKIASFDTPERV